MGKKDQDPKMAFGGSGSDYVMINLITHIFVYLFIFFAIISPFILTKFSVWICTYFPFAAKYNSKCFLFYGFNIKMQENYLATVTKITTLESQFRACIF